ncbi:MAG: DEAD/DEAH box helicase family protein [Rhizobiales bacterium]|nr:DEAD/DEAH box helicase family protein [Hyphomicrobiales bacterium]NRB13252.1 DEAD/DEAH box helicase family protein [Hyphomicrobiales bacterium]
MQDSKYNLLDDLSDSYNRNFGFMPNTSLVANWQQLATQLDTMVASGKNGIVVSQMSTGTGKTHCLAKYLSNCLPTETDAFLQGKYSNGILVVCRTIQQGRKLADEINCERAEPIAFAFNSDTKSEANSLSHYPVLVITAAKYENLLLEQYDGCPFAKLDNQLMTYSCFRRDLTIIDESYGFTKSWVTDLSSLRQVHALISDTIGDEYSAENDKDFSNEMHFIQVLIDKLKDCGTLTVFDFKDHQIECDFMGLSAKVSSSKLHHVLLIGEDGVARAKLVRIIKDVLETLHRISTSYCLVERSGNRLKIGTSVSLMPKDEHSNILILDATASLFPLYELMVERVKISPRIEGSRDYSNLTVFSSNGNTVGKTQLRKNFAQHSKCLTGAIKQSGSSSEDLLIVCPKSVETDVKKLKYNVHSVSFGTWGAIDGKNDWINTSSLFLFGLPYRDNFSSLLEYFALAGQQSPAWLQSSNDNAGDRKSVVRRIKQGHMISSIIQALNRCQIRTSVNSSGLCPPTNIYLPLGAENEANFILDAIRSEMPNTQFGELKYGDVTTNRGGNRCVVQVLDYLNKSVSKEPILLKDLKEDLGISKSSFDRFKKRLKDNDEQLISSLAVRGWSYYSVGSGKGARQWFERAEHINLEEIFNVAA